MLSKINNFAFAISLVALFSNTAPATELFHLNEKVVGFTNYSEANSVFLLSEKGTSYQLTDSNLKQGSSYQIDATCNLKTQNTSSMDGSEAGMLLAYPYFVGLGKICRVDETTKKISLVSDFRKQLPRNTFTLSYAGSDERSVYFVINGRIYPEGESGYIYSLAINKANNSITLKNFITDVPGFSAAMVYDAKQLSIATWMGNNQIYSIDSTNLLKLIQSEKTYNFSAVTTKIVEDFEGLSSFVLKNETDFLFYNNEYESYSISSSSKMPAPKVFASTCEPISGYKNKWLLLCNSNSVVLE